MQKTVNKVTSAAKVVKKTKKMGTPSPPKKKKATNTKLTEETGNKATMPVSKTKNAAKKTSAVPKKTSAGRKDSKITLRNTTKSQGKNLSEKTAVAKIKKVVVKKLVKTKTTPAVKSDTSISKTTPEIKNKKNDECDLSSPKAKKMKKSSTEEQVNQKEKVTAKKQSNSKIIKKLVDFEININPTGPNITCVEIKNDIISSAKKILNNEKKPANIVEKSKEAPEKLEQKSKMKIKAAAKKINSHVASVEVKKPPKKVALKKQIALLKTENLDVEQNDKINQEIVIKEPKDVTQQEKKALKKDEKKEEKVLDSEKNRVKKYNNDEINSKETIAKLLKEASKIILKEKPKKRRDGLKIRTNSSTIIKKSKLVKQKPKKAHNEIIIKKEPEDIKEETDSKKIEKKSVKVKKKPIKEEEKIILKEEEPTNTEKTEKGKNDEQNTNTDDSTTSDELTLHMLRQNQECEPVTREEGSNKIMKKPAKIKAEKDSDSERKYKPLKKYKQRAQKNAARKKKMVIIKKRVLKNREDRSASTDTEQKARKMKLYGFWSGPKRHRVASLNALAKVHCLYENESRGALYDVIKRSPVTKESNSEPEPTSEPVEASTRTLRSVPGLRGVGKHWEMHEITSSSEDNNSNDSSVEAPRKLLTPPPSYKQKQREAKKVEEQKKKPPRKKRNRTELIMDLKDMVVRKRMASLNASAILAASYSVEKKPLKSPKSETSESEDSDTSSASDKKRQCYEPDIKKEEDRKVIEVRASPNKKVAVILNQDTDVTITGVYVNSTRSTHHEGYCSIAGMQYRISATSHTQTAATAVATETLMHPAPEHGQGEQPLSAPCKSYTPLGALSSMQPPGAPPPPVSPSGRRHGCPSAFTAPPAYGPHPPPHHHHPPPPPPPPPPQQPPPSGPGLEQPPPTYIHGYYQPAGPLITAHHGHAHPTPISTGKGAPPPLPTLEASPSPTPPPSATTTTHQPPPSSTGTAESSDNEVIITSASSGSEPVAVPLPPAAQPYRYAQYSTGTHGPPAYSYSYPPPSQYYHGAAPPPPTAAAFAQQQHYHHDLCYPGTSYPPSYLHPKAYTTTFRRYLAAPPPSGHQYYSANPDLYSAPPANSQSSQVVSASSGAAGSGYQPPPTGPPPPTIVESYAPPPPPVPPTIVEPYPPPHYYTGYSAAPAPPACYSHSPPTRNLTFIDAAYQSCPCPMQSCPKNVHTGPLTGDGKRSNVTAIAKESMPLPPVALALPLEPASVAGPPSPARGSAGMPPPPSPAGATYQPTPAPKWDTKQETETVLECKVAEKRRPARLGKTMARNNITSNFNNTPPQGMLLMCHNPPQPTSDVVNTVKREVESPQELPITQQKHERLPDIEKTSTCEEPIKQTDELTLDSKVQNISDECSKRLNAEELNQNLKNEEDCSSECVPAQTDPVRRKSLVEETKIPQQKTEPSETVIQETEPPPIPKSVERTCVKRKLSVEDVAEDLNEYKVQSKKQKTNSKCKVPNGSYKDLIKKSSKFIKINNGKRKLNIECEVKTAETKFPIFKTPKILLGGKSKKTKRKQTATKDEPANKKSKASKPLVASNLHNSKQNVKNKEKLSQLSSDLPENKEPAKKTGQKKVSNQVNSKFTVNNVDRTIESVVLNIEEPVRTSSVKPEVCKHVGRQSVVDLKAAESAKNNNVIRPVPAKVAKVGSGRSGTSKKRTKATCALVLPVPRIPRKSIHMPRWSNGWSWQGEPFQGKIFLNSDEALVVRKCYPSMRHTEGDVISPRDCVLLKAGPRKTDLPFVAKVAYLWENPEDGEMMMSLLWYYRPEHTEQGRRPIDQPDEVFASRHKDTNSVACIEDKCYVLTFNEYCRYRKTVRRLEEGMEPSGQVVPLPEGGVYYRMNRQPPTPLTTSSDLVFFCRQVYDFRQKRLVKNPS